MQNTSANSDIERTDLKYLLIVWGIFLMLTILPACSAQIDNQEYIEDPTDFFPTFNDPPGATRPGGGGGGSSDKRGEGFDLVSDLPIEEVHQFYAEQLTAEGWVNLSENFEPDVFISYWDGFTDNGQIWPAILEVTTTPVNPQANYAVELRAVLPPYHASGQRKMNFSTCR